MLTIVVATVSIPDIGAIDDESGSSSASASASGSFSGAEVSVLPTSSTVSSKVGYFTDLLSMLFGIALACSVMFVRRENVDASEALFSLIVMR